MKKVNWLGIKIGILTLSILKLGTNVGYSQVVEMQSPIKPLKSGNTIYKSLSSSLMSQITSVSELRDVAPTDWAYEVLRSLIERYGCIVGYPDRTFRGNQPLSRWEFAAGLNAYLNTLEVYSQVPLA